MKHTLIEYMNNPAGKGSTVIPNRQLLIDDYRRRYGKIKEHHKFESTIYKIKNDYLFHILVPSEDKDKDINYDVVVQFTMLGEDFRNDITTNRYFVKFFSNCPSFVYTFTHAYYTNDILIEELMSKYRDEIFDKAPETRNPQQLISFEKSIYFACLHIIDNPSYRNIMYLNTHSKSSNIKNLLKSVRTTDSILMEYKKAALYAKQLKNTAKKKIDTSNKISTKHDGKRKNTINKIQPKSKKSSSISKKTSSKKIGSTRSTSKGKK